VCAPVLENLGPGVLGQTLDGHLLLGLATPDVVQLRGLLGAELGGLAHLEVLLVEAVLVATGLLVRLVVAEITLLLGFLPGSLVRGPALGQVLQLAALGLLGSDRGRVGGWGLGWG
jgi:hypothetical protein